MQVVCWDLVSPLRPTSDVRRYRSLESEFIAASQCGQEVVYISENPKEFGAEQDNCTQVFEDNQACIAVSENTVHRERSRHIDVRKYYVWELVEEKLIID